MNINEFKAWLDGFSAAVHESPTKEQWEIIKKKISDISGDIKYDLHRPGYRDLSFPYTLSDTPTVWETSVVIS